MPTLSSLVLVYKCTPTGLTSPVPRHILTELFSCVEVGRVEKDILRGRLPEEVFENLRSSGRSMIFDDEVARELFKVELDGGYLLLIAGEE